MTPAQARELWQEISQATEACVEAAEQEDEFHDRFSREKWGKLQAMFEKYTGYQVE